LLKKKEAPGAAWAVLFEYRGKRLFILTDHSPLSRAKNKRIAGNVPALILGRRNRQPF
jgi:hypothetical protein